MNKCGKSAMILRKPESIKLHNILKQLGKPSYPGEENVVKLFQWYSFRHYFLSRAYHKPIYVFEASIFAWWQKHADFSLVLKSNIHVKRQMSLNILNVKSEIGGAKTCTTFLTLIPGTGLFISLFALLCVEIISSRARRNKICLFYKKCLITLSKLLQHAWHLVLKLISEVEKVLKRDINRNYLIVCIIKFQVNNMWK